MRIYSDIKEVNAAETDIKEIYENINKSFPLCEFYTKFRLVINKFRPVNSFIQNYIQSLGESEEINVFTEIYRMFFITLKNNDIKFNKNASEINNIFSLIYLLSDKSHNWDRIGKFILQEIYHTLENNDILHENFGKFIKSQFQEEDLNLSKFIINAIQKLKNIWESDKNSLNELILNLFNDEKIEEIKNNSEKNLEKWNLDNDEDFKKINYLKKFIKENDFGNFFEIELENIENAIKKLQDYEKNQFKQRFCYGMIEKLYFNECSNITKNYFESFIDKFDKFKFFEILFEKNNKDKKFDFVFKIY